ncbi:MAG TPA: CARDB domain-containing protein, partial [Phycisphaerae bacterium]|nr:CARDB domain-containing protein [Phycisphaerae bacterium]
DATPKPGYFALKDLIALLSESKWDAKAGRWIRPAPFPTRALTFALRGATESVHHTLLQRSDGSFQLLLWNEVPSIDLRAQKDIRNTPIPVRLVLHDPAARITVSRLGPDAPPPSQFESVREIDLAVPDEVIVVGIRLAKPLRPAPLAPPADIEVKASPSSVELSWPVRKGADAYWVSLNQRNCGPAQRGPDGKARFRMSGLLPAMTYPFEIVAVSRDGGVSVPAKVSASTVDASPDLVVLNLKTIPESPKEGETVTFVAVVENRGNAATDSGVAVGVKFGVDGKTVCWSDSFRGPLAPGQKVELKPNNGPGGKSSWVMTRGCHRVTAYVDDVNRIAEIHEGNNGRTIPVGTGDGPDLVIPAVTVQEARQGKPLVVDVTVANAGSDAVPKGSRVSASVFGIDEKRPRLLGYAISREGIPAGGKLTLTVKCASGLEPGKHKLQAVADDVNRIPELDETNNRAEFEVDVGTTAETQGDAPAK